MLTDRNDSQSAIHSQIITIIIISFIFHPAPIFYIYTYRGGNTAHTHSPHRLRVNTASDPPRSTDSEITDIVHHI